MRLAHAVPCRSWEHFSEAQVSHPWNQCSSAHPNGSEKLLVIPRSACKNPVTTPTPRATYSLQRAIQHQSGFQISLECTSAAHPGSTQSQKNAKYTYSWHMGEAFGSALPCSPQFSKQKRYAFNPVSLTTWEILKVWFFFFKAESSSGYHFQSFCL